MNKFFTSLLVATAVGLSAVGTQAMPLRSNQAGQFDQFSRWDVASAFIADRTADAAPMVITAVATGAPRL
jgi:hypothetical protein